jgi:hypothetical protein
MLGARAHLCGMTVDTSTALPAASSGSDDGGPCPAGRAATAGGRLAAASRAAQGLPVTVDDAAVLARLRDLCSAPRAPQPGRCG